MSIFQSISDFFESIFKRSSPEVQKKQQLKKLDAELREFEPCIYKNGNLQPNFAEAIYNLYKNTKVLDDLFMTTVSSSDIPRQHRFEAQLILTGYSREYQEIIAGLSFEARKEEIMNEPQNSERIYIHQKTQCEKVIKELNSESFRRIDKDILALRQLVDFCHIMFVPLLQIFDLNFRAADFNYKPEYTEIPITKAVNLLEDLYYQISGMKITTSIADQVIALAQLRKGSVLSNDESEIYLTSLKKINYIITKILTVDRLKALVRMAKQNVTYEPDVASYTGSPRQEFANIFQTRFDADEQKIKSEIQDEQITSEVSALFKNNKLDTLFGYNAESNAMLQPTVTLSFQWVLPMRILKTFLRIYLTDGVKGLLNDLVIEGFFNNPTYKSEFSTTVYAAINAAVKLQEFEDSFGNDQHNSIAVMQSYVTDSHKDKDFYRKLEKMVVTTNNEAHELLQAITANLHTLYRYLGELLADSKKPSSEIISNLKVLMISSRNKENTNTLEIQYPDWKIFFEIMKNYVIINNSGDVQ
ncbi:MAG: hypothetical protein IKR64_08215 [Treponema sp.]|nr:hypothetical protein [Treponema sp.]